MNFELHLWDHIRHRRGFAVHSPFMYGVVRQAMMPRRIVGTQKELYDALVAQGVDRRTATRLQNYLCHLGYEQWAIDTASIAGGLVVATRNCNDNQVRTFVHTLAEGQGEATLAIVHRNDTKRKALAKEFVANHHSMSASKSNFTFLVYGKALPKQHIIL